ncbi:MAG: hypothetical protein JWN88_1822 [Frankiales bacterium]|jgi:hypothetical protein|nr:hypothetical protein [Frankiales bacterium]
MSDQFDNPYPPMPGQPYSGPASAGPAPARVENAFKLMLARAALSLVGIVTAFATKDALTEQLQPEATTSNVDVDTLVTAALTVAAVIGLILAVLYVLLALQVRKGKSWARIVTLVIAGLSILFGLFGLFGDAPAISKLLSVLILVIDIAIVAMLVDKKSAAFFDRA